MISVIVFEVNNAAEQKRAYLVTNFLFFISVHCRQLLPPLPYRCSGVPGNVLSGVFVSMTLRSSSTICG